VTDFYRETTCDGCGQRYRIILPPTQALASEPCPRCGRCNYVSEYRRMDVGLSELCNLECNMCRRPQEKAAISYERAFAALVDAKRIGVTTLSFSGGEPFVHPDFRRILSEAVELGFEVELVTNGTLVRETDVQILERLRCVTISVDGPEEVHDEIRGRAGSWRKTMRTIEILAGSRAQWGVNCVVQAANAEHLEELWREVRYRGRPSYVSFCHVEVIPETRHLQASPELIEVSKKSINRIRAKCERDQIHFNDPDFHGENTHIFSRKARRYRPLMGCQIPRRFLGFSQHGYFPCWHQGRALKEASLIEALESDLCREIVQEGLGRRCVGCNAANYSWDPDWTSGVISAHQAGEWESGEIYLSNAEREAKQLTLGRKSIPLIERSKKEGDRQ
jgi:MoaA/NifB/PqqE/SkfB family radical SAM enzyme